MLLCPKQYQTSVAWRVQGRPQQGTGKGRQGRRGSRLGYGPQESPTLPRACFTRWAEQRTSEGHSLELGRPSAASGAGHSDSVVASGLRAAGRHGGCGWAPDCTIGSTRWAQLRDLGGSQGSLPDSGCGVHRCLGHAPPLQISNRVSICYMDVGLLLPGVVKLVVGDQPLERASATPVLCNHLGTLIPTLWQRCRGRQTCPRARTRTPRHSPTSATPGHGCIVEVWPRLCLCLCLYPCCARAVVKRTTVSAGACGKCVAPRARSEWVRARRRVCRCEAGDRAEVVASVGVVVRRVVPEKAPWAAGPGGPA